MHRTVGALANLALLLGTVTVQADIFRWDNGQVIPGTKGIMPGPGVDLSGWNSDAHNLRYGQFSNSPYFPAERDLTGATFRGSWLDNAGFYSAKLTGADLTGAVVTGAQFGDTTSRGFTAAHLYSTQSYAAKDLSGIGLWNDDLTGWDFHEQNLANARLDHSTLSSANLMGVNLTNAEVSDSTLTNTNLTGAVVTGTQFLDATQYGFTAGQLYSTQSYAAKDLSGIGLQFNDLSDWDLHEQNLTNARLDHSTLYSANLTGANLTNAGLSSSELSSANLMGAHLTNAYLIDSTLRNANLTGANLANANFHSSNLTGANLTGANLANAGLYSSRLTSANLTGANLANAYLYSSRLTSANLTGAMVTGANFDDTTSRGFRAAQLYSTQNYAAKDLSAIGLNGNDLTGWDFHEQNLTNADFFSSTLASANLTGAVVTGANFGGTTSRGLTAAQLYSTQSYAAKDLSGIGLNNYNDLTGWDFHEQNLAHAYFGASTLQNTDLTGAVVTGADFGDTTSRGFTAAQIYSTQSYAAKDLSGIGLQSNDLSGWDFHEQNLTNADLRLSTLIGANLTGADTRGAFYGGLSLTGAILKNTILPDGRLNGLDLQAGEQLVVRDDDGVPDPLPSRLTARSPIPVTIQDHLTMAGGGILELHFDADPWDSLISFQAGIPVKLGGTLDLTFAKDADPASQVGHTLHLFNWTGVSPSGRFTVSSRYDWDLSNLYTTGEVTLLAAGNVIAGDANGDGKVDTTDFGTLKDHFGTPGAKAEGDANGDRHIDLVDFGLLKENFGKSAVAVPEPATIILAVLGALVLLCRPRVLGRVAAWRFVEILVRSCRDLRSSDWPIRLCPFSGAIDC